MNDPKKLGFGLMRLPMIGDDIDIETTKKMVDLFLEKGFNYFDTAYVYGEGKSELAANECLSKRHPRESFMLASKLPISKMQKPEDAPAMFQVSLDRTGAQYFDYYLLHCLTEANAKKADEMGAWDYLLSERKAGRIKKLGFSFHDTAAVLDEILTKHPEAEFVQLQINYADWDSDSVQSRLCYETACKHGKKVIVMEPVKGGSLSNLPDSVKKIFDSYDSSVSMSSWAIRFAASLPNVQTVLSGMSNMEQMEDNLKTMVDFKPLSVNELGILFEAQKTLKNLPQIPCTGCEYCIAGCPQGIKIPKLLKSMNQHMMYNDQRAVQMYKRWSEEGKKASECLKCGACERICPQHLPIIKHLEETAAVFEK